MGGAVVLDQNVHSGGAGGSGIVIIRYPANCAPPASVTGGPQVLYNNGVSDLCLYVLWDNHFLRRNHGAFCRN